MNEIPRETVKVVTKMAGHTCELCGRVCKSAIGLRQHMKKEKNLPFFNLEAIEQRRKQVLLLKMRGMNAKTIANVLGVTPEVVYQDTIAIRKRNLESLKNMAIDERIANELQVYDAMEGQAIDDLFLGKVGSVGRSVMYSHAREWKRDKIQFMQSIGLLPKNLGSLQVFMEGKDFEHMTSAELEEERRKIMDEIVKLKKVERKNDTGANG